MISHEIVSFVIFIMAIILQDFTAGILSAISIKEEVSSWFSIFILQLNSIVVDQRSHEGIISFTRESIGNLPIISTMSISIII